MSYDDPITYEYFNIHVRGDLALHNAISNFMVTRPQFQRYQVVKTMLEMGTYDVHEAGVEVRLEELCEEKEQLWLEIHNSLRQYVKELEA